MKNRKAVLTYATIKGLSVAVAGWKEDALLKLYEKACKISWRKDWPCNEHVCQAVEYRAGLPETAATSRPEAKHLH